MLSVYYTCFLVAITSQGGKKAKDISGFRKYLEKSVLANPVDVSRGMTDIAYQGQWSVPYDKT